MSGPIVVRGDARRLPLPAASVDLIVTSPPYFALRSYTDGGQHYAGQIGSEPTPAAYIAALIECTREWMRVLKPSGSIFVNLGDKYVSDNRGSGYDPKRGGAKWAPAGTGGFVGLEMARQKSLMLLPERYRIACVDQLGLIARAVIVWAKPNGLPESVTDRVRRSHEDWVHLTKAPRYYAAVDEIRESAVRTDRRATAASYAAGVMIGKSMGHTGLSDRANHPLGSLPGSVWEISTEPLKVPERLGVDHFAAFPSEWPRRLILGWSPAGICAACGEGRRPVTQTDLGRKERLTPVYSPNGDTRHGKDGSTLGSRGPSATIVGYACACTPYTDHPGTGEKGRPYSDDIADGRYPRTQSSTQLWDRPPSTAPRREYHFDRWTPPPTRPAVVLDPFGGTGTTAHVAAALGRTGITVDLSADYCRVAAAPELYHQRRRKVLGLDKPTVAVVPEGQLGFDWEGASA